MSTRRAVGIRVPPLTVVIGVFLVFLGTAAGGSQPAVVPGTQLPGHLPWVTPGLPGVSSGESPGGDAVLAPGGVLRVPPGTTVVPGRVLVRFRPGFALRARSAALSRVDASVGTAYHLVPRLELLHLPAGTSVLSAIASLSRDPQVQYAVPDLAVRVAATPNDPSYPSQWALPAIGAPAAWNRTTGSAGVTVAVLDTGVDLTHPDLAANLVPGWNFVSNTSDPSDDYGHGTHVAGIIGAVGNNGVGIAGINWHVSIMPLKICDANGLCDLDKEVSALQYAVDHGAMIANASFGGVYAPYPPEENAIAAAGQAGLLFVAAAGNSANNNDFAPFYPASYPLDNVISVAATTSSGDLASFSDYGFSSVSIGAPGEDILSTLPTSGPISSPTGYGTESGTSMAAPEVTGAAALLWAEHPDWTMQQVRMRLLETASPLVSLQGKVADCGQLDVGAATDPTVADHAIVCVSLSGTGGGSVTSDPVGINCSGAGCMESVPIGTPVTLTATPSSGSTFAGWGGACSGTGTCLVTASGVGGVTATFSAPGSPPGWQQKRLHSPAGRDPFAPGSSPDFTFYNAAVSGDGTERAETIYNPPTTGNVSYCTYDTTDTGGVFLERRTSAGWVADGKITAPSVPAWSGDGGARWANCSYFGQLTQLSADGTTLLVAPDSTYVSSSVIKYRCAAYVYRRGSGGWALDAVLYPPGIDAGGSDTPGGCGYFGSVGVLSGDGNRVALLTHGVDSSGDTTSALYADIYVQSGGTWSLEQQITLPNPNADCGEGHVSLSNDGATMLVGNATCDANGLTVAGLVYAYVRSGSQWTLAQTIHSPQPAGFERFGESTALSADGNTAVIGSLDFSGNATWIFERDASGWHKSALLPYPSPYYSCPDIVQDGARIFCSGSQETVGFNSTQGAIYIYDRPSGGWASAQPQALRAFASDGFAGDTLGSSGIAAPEDGSFVDAIMSFRGLASGAYPHDRIGSEFTTGQVDQTLTVSSTGSGFGAIASAPTGIDCGSICWHDFSAGASVTLNPTPQEGSSFAGWSGACSGTGSCTLTMNADQSVTATFTLIPETLDVSLSGAGSGSVTSAPVGISCGSTCSDSFDWGTRVTLTPIPATGSSFSGWTGACTGTGTCRVTMTEAQSVTATFTVIPESLTVSRAGNGSGIVTSIPGGISCGWSCGFSYNYGASVQLNATPATGATFAGWSGGGCSGTGSCTVSMTHATSVTATFTLIPETLKASKAGTGAGSVTSSPTGISCGATCAHSYGYGTSVRLTATHAVGSSFAGWTGGGCSGTGICTVSMTQARSVTATFTLIPESLTVSKPGTGSGTVTSSPPGVSCGSTCSHTFSYGKSVTLTAQAASGSVFTGWSGACTGTSARCHVSMTAARAVTASFAVANLLIVTKVGRGGGAVTSSPAGISCGVICSHWFAAGTVVTLTATAKSGSKFAGWSGSCSGTGKCVVKMSAIRSANATFTLTASGRRTGSSRHSRLQGELERLFGRLAFLVPKL